MPRRIKSQKPTYVVLATASVATAAFVTLLLSRFMNPCTLQVLQKRGIDNGESSEYLIYHDFDKDGISETVHVENNARENSYGIAVFNFAGFFVDECHYSEPIILSEWRRHGLLFEDYNEDGYDEIFAFTQVDDSLFLYIHDLRSKQVLLNRQWMLKTQKPSVDRKSTFSIRQGALVDIGTNRRKALVFAAVSGFRPRGVYIFDTEELTITKRFESEAYPGELLLYDLTGDGKEEIILTTLATGNIHYPAPYSDDRCWLFVFDQKLSPVFEPLSFGEYSSRLVCSKIEIASERLLLLTYWYIGEKKLQDFICLVDSRGKIRPRKYISEGIASPGVVVDNTSVPPTLYCASNQGNLLKLNEQLNITARRSSFYKGVSILDGTRLRGMVDLQGDGKSELIYGSDTDIMVYDRELKLRARFSAPGHTGVISFRETGKGNPLEIGLNSDKYFYRFAFRKNELHSLLPFLTIGLAALTFGLLAGGYRFSSLLFTYFSFCRFFLTKSAHGMVLLNSAGRIYFINHRVQPLLDLKNPARKMQHFVEAFEERPKLVDIIQKSIETNQVQTESILAVRGDFHFEGEISVTPMVSRLRLLRTYLVQIQDYTAPIASDRLRLWSRSVQKMAHDIKTPLSSVKLNLAALQMRVEGGSPGDREQMEDDIEMMRTELERVYQITRSFLKLSTLEKPRFQVIDVHQVAQYVKDRFQNFTPSEVQIEIDFEPDVDGVWGDPQQVELLLDILIENAIDALKGGGLISINGSVAQYLDESFQKYVEIEVADNGPGIDPLHHDKIFEAYFTTKPEGTGMGLAIAKKIVEDHEGKIAVYSKPDFGTVIRFSLPIITESGET